MSENYSLSWQNADLKAESSAKNMSVAVKLCLGTPFLPPGVPPTVLHTETYVWGPGTNSLSSINHREMVKINVRIRRDGDTCLSVMWYLFFLQEQEHQSSPVEEICVIREMSYGSCIKSLVTPPCKLLAACFCSLTFASGACCVYKLNSNYTTGWQSSEFVHLREAWHFGMAVNT